MMPELPEVETVVQTLKNLVLHKKIIKVDVFWDNIIVYDVEEFKKVLINQHINDIKRKGKVIIFELDDYDMLSHLRMEGKYYFDHSYIRDKYTHVIFTFDDKTYLRYHDVRKFGKISLCKKEALLEHPFIKDMGPEPFNITKEELYAKLQKKRIPIKSALLDQHIMAGLGNIYTDEVLFRAKIHPLRKANSVSLQECHDIITDSISILNKAIALGGTTIRSYTSSLGVTGRFQNELLVHTKENEPCPVCHHKIVKIEVNGRGTYFCPHCQKK